MSRFITGTIAKVQKETANSVTLTIEVPEADKKAFFNFKPGQFLTFSTKLEGEVVRRTYSICVSPAENILQVAVKQMHNGLFSNWANNNLKKGTQIDIMPPQGNFTPPISSKNKKNYLAFVAGSGITPVMSLMKTILAQEPDSTFTLFYGNKNSNSVMFKEAIAALKNKYINRLAVYHILSREPADSELLSGRISVQKCKALSKIFYSLAQTDEVLLCGPGDMIVQLKDYFLSEGIAEKNIHFELFTTPGEGKQKQKKKIQKSHLEAASKVTVILDGQHTTFDLSTEKEAILDAAIKHGMDAPFACKGAVCATCKAKITKGEVEMDMNYALSKEELQSGFVLTCQSHPVSKKVTVDYDHL